MSGWPFSIQHLNMQGPGDDVSGSLDGDGDGVGYGDGDGDGDDDGDKCLSQEPAPKKGIPPSSSLVKYHDWGL